MRQAVRQMSRTYMNAKSCVGYITLRYREIQEHNEI